MMGSRKKRRRARRPEPSSAKPSRRKASNDVLWIALSLCALVVVAFYLLRANWPSGRQPAPEVAAGPATSGSKRDEAAAEGEKAPSTGDQQGQPKESDPPATPARDGGSGQVEFDKLEGKWRRLDGGYLIEVKSVDDDGAMEAAYFNPGPIHVSQAQARRVGDQAKVFIELRDVNYPGCTYDLDYNPQDDRLEGVYHQTAIGQQFEVVFEREP